MGTCKDLFLPAELLQSHLRMALPSSFAWPCGFPCSHASA